MRRFPENDIISLVANMPRYDLAESIGPDLRIGELAGAGGADLAELALAYGTAEGGAELRAAIGAMHGAGADDVVLTVGGVHALFLLAFTLCERGDEVVAVTPEFPLASNALQAVGAQVRRVRLAFDAGYRLDPAALQAQLTPATRLVCLATPQNPSGVAIPAHTLREVLAAMDARCPEAFLQVDETYRQATYGDDPPAPSAVALDPRVVSVGSLSKSHGAPGLRLGWAVTRQPALRRQLALAKFNTVISCSAVDEALALAVLARGGRILGERRRHLAACVEATAAWVADNPRLVEWVRPQAGAICCLRLRAEVFGDGAVERFHAALAAHDTRVARGAWFGDEARVFRLGFGLLEPPALREALAALGAALEEAACGTPAGA